MKSSNGFQAGRKSGSAKARFLFTPGYSRQLLNFHNHLEGRPLTQAIQEAARGEASSA